MNKLFGHRFLSRFFIIFSISISNLIRPADTVPGVNFNIGPHAFYAFQGRFFVGATQAGIAKEFAIAAVNRAEAKFKALALEKVTLNTKADQKNPLFNAAVAHLGVFGNKLVAIKADEPSSLFLIDDIRYQNSVASASATAQTKIEPILVTSISGIADAVGNPAAKVAALAVQAMQNGDSSELEDGVAVFLAIANQLGSFDGSGSGIAYVGLARKKTDTSNTNTEANTNTNANGNSETNGTNANNNNANEVEVWQLFDAQEGKPNGNRASAISSDTPALKINGTASAVGTIVDIYWDKLLARLYIALQVQAGAGVTDGARALLVGSVVNGKIVFQPIAIDQVFNNTDKIVGTMGSLSQSELYKVRTLFTSTHLKYLVVVGTSGDVSQAKRKVFALPLVDAPGLLSHGTLAQVTSLPIEQIVPVEPLRFQTRRFIRPALVPTDVFTASSSQAIVGGGADLPGDITDIVAFKDAVFVSVGVSTGNLQPGIFFSQAIFDGFGRITGWTTWHRAGTARGANGFDIDFYNGIFSFMPIGLGGISQTVMRTNWTTGTTDFEKLVSTQLPSNRAGAQGLFDFEFSTPSFTSQVGSRLSVLAITGAGKILLLQSGTDTGGLFGPQADFSQIFTSTNGTLNGFSGARGLSLSGGELENIGLITSCAIVSDGVYGWLVVGGSRGIAVLARPDGTGWLVSPGLSSGFQGLTADMRFVRLGNFTQVRKLVSVENKLFIVTPSSLERVIIDASLSSASTVLAQNTDFGIAQTTLTDFVISGPLGVLGTSIGLFRSGNSVDIRSVNNKTASQWTPVVLPEAVGSISSIRQVAPIIKLLAIGTSGTEISGNIYVLNGYVGYHQAQVYRLALSGDKTTVSDQTIAQFPDIYTSNQRTFFFGFGTYRNNIFTDGADFFATRNAYSGNRPFLSILSPLVRSGSVDRNIGIQEVPINILNSHFIGTLLRSSSSGNWLVNGDFGIRTNE